MQAEYQAGRQSCQHIINYHKVYWPSNKNGPDQLNRQDHFVETLFF